MILIAAALIAFVMVGLYVHHVRATNESRRVDVGLRESEYLRFIQALGEIHEAILAIEIPPLDLSPLVMTDQVVTLLHEHMDTIHRDMAVLTTRVETGPGKRMLRVP